MSAAVQNAEAPVVADAPMVLSPRIIAVWQERINQAPVPFGPESVTRTINLEEVMREYLYDMGYGAGHVRAVVQHLLAEGKVVVTGVRGWERVMLVDWTRPYHKDEAARVVDAFFAANDAG